MNSSDPLLVQPCPLREKTWIEIRLLGEDQRPVPGVAYRIALPDGQQREGQLDADGQARVDDIDPGTCVVTFPELDQDAWDRL